MPRSGLANNRTTTGVIWASYSSSDSFCPICITVPNTLAPPPPNSTDLSSSGSTFILKKSAGKSSATASSFLIRISIFGQGIIAGKPTQATHSARPQL